MLSECAPECLLPGGFIKEWINVVSHYGGGALTTPAMSATSNSSNARPYGQPRWPANGQLAGNGGSPMLYPNKARINMNICTCKHNHNSTHHQKI